MNYEEKCGVFFRPLDSFAGGNFDTLFSTAPSETLTGTYFKCIRRY